VKLDEVSEVLVMEVASGPELPDVVGVGEDDTEFEKVRDEDVVEVIDIVGLSELVTVVKISRELLVEVVSSAKLVDVMV